jgi:hypothetical protein
MRLGSDPDDVATAVADLLVPLIPRYVEVAVALASRVDLDSVGLTLWEGQGSRLFRNFMAGFSPEISGNGFISDSSAPRAFEVNAGRLGSRFAGQEGTDNGRFTVDELARQIRARLGDSVPAGPLVVGTNAASSGGNLVDVLDAYASAIGGRPSGPVHVICPYLSIITYGEEQANQESYLNRYRHVLRRLDLPPDSSLLVPAYHSGDDPHENMLLVLARGTDVEIDDPAKVSHFQKKAVADSGLGVRHQPMAIAVAKRLLFRAGGAARSAYERGGQNIGGIALQAIKPVLLGSSDTGAVDEHISPLFRPSHPLPGDPNGHFHTGGVEFATLRGDVVVPPKR